MIVSQHILVCAEDPVLAKKIRFLLARDECDVEILARASELEPRLRDGGLALVILSRNLDGQDAIERLARFDAELRMPPTLVLGGHDVATPEFIHLIPDPFDTRTIYRLASEVLNTAPLSDDLSRDDRTHVSLEPPVGLPVLDADIDEIVVASESFGTSASRGFGEIVGKLERIERAEAGEGFDIVESPEVDDVDAELAGTIQGQLEAPVMGGSLDPVRFAKAVFDCWSTEKTGCLTVERGRETLRIDFERGNPAGVETSIPGDPLGLLLVDRHRLTRTQYAEGAMRAIERGTKIGDAFVELGFLSHEELEEEHATSASEQLIACFEAREGTFEFDPKAQSATRGRTHVIDVGRVLVEGLRRYADRDALADLAGNPEDTYFKLRSAIEDLRARIPFDDAELTFLSFEGRAYNVNDAADAAGIDRDAACRVIALLRIVNEIVDFTPDVRAFEQRIREERRRSQLPGSAPPSPSDPGRVRPSTTPTTERPAITLPPPIPSPGRHESQDVRDTGPLRMTSSGEVGTRTPPPAPPPDATTRASPLRGPITQPSPAVSARAPFASNTDMPPMPVPAPGAFTAALEPMVYADPLPRGPDGTPIETPDRTRSREQFQKGVTLLGQGGFAGAEASFRKAVALCSDEHVYLIGLARAIYYNAEYQADRKVRVLRDIVDRARRLAPDDHRVTTLDAWVAAAEQQYA